MSVTATGTGPEATNAATALLADLRTQLPELKLLTDEIDRESYRSDETAHYTAGLPLAVALP
ncbi:MAG: FAD-binding oxidoreductase, partial [Candidatus Limnocylindria bacterium]